ncbi:putative cysteine desulfurase [Desulfonema limicola]|uniref:Cysteine desulfurase n=1 Tax=Desulfonema limicola TaxID=45656 RepID=A0A975B9S8_9BACT|nr:aminotransferase class V-fold PLP-dependent enzyme [Desulfonema limicola]QTA81369.1 putative cysteine desulfurase [Desulfonema limicola]
MFWKKIQDAYPVNKYLIWLNNCGTTPAGTHVVEAVSNFIQGYSQKGLLTETAGFHKVKQGIKAILCRLMNCSENELCLIHNTSEGMNYISHGFDLKAGDEIILLENEYPSNIYPWQHWEEKGVILKTAPVSENPEQFLEQLKKNITDKTRVISLSLVHWCTGMPLPIEETGLICREKNIEFVVDGAQGVGLIDVDVKKMNIGFMAFSAWKWLMGPLGLGVMYIAKNRLEKLKPIFKGTESVIKDEEYLPYKSELKPGADRFTISTPGFTDWVYFLESLEFLNNIGFKKVQDRIFYLADYLGQRLRQIGFEVYSDRFPGHKTGIVVCEKKEISCANLVLQLNNDKIICVERLGRIRFAPHVYISEHQIDSAVRSLSQACISHMYSKSVTRQGGYL